MTPSSMLNSLHSGVVALARNRFKNSTASYLESDVFLSPGDCAASRSVANGSEDNISPDLSPAVSDCPLGAAAFSSRNAGQVGKGFHTAKRESVTEFRAFIFTRTMDCWIWLEEFAGVLEKASGKSRNLYCRNLFFMINATQVAHQWYQNRHI